MNEHKHECIIIRFWFWLGRECVWAMQCSVFLVPWHGVIVSGHDGDDSGWWPRPHSSIVLCLLSLMIVWCLSLASEGTQAIPQWPLPSPRRQTVSPVTSGNDPGIGFSFLHRHNTREQILISNRWVIWREECNYKCLLLNLLAINNSRLGILQCREFLSLTRSCDSWRNCFVKVCRSEWGWSDNRYMWL